ncbi:MAG TPA: Wzz/FepE/Etk N-terminal domain-containing protein [Caulobacteraceae bacterium]|nr:Wzz/FepE/Etk N-terminal domain-containing protein [Caulobacteraceae bacterium]
MSIQQFLRIFWARRMIIVAATLACLVGGIVVGFVVPPKYTAHAKVMLDLMRPDPVTGQGISSNSARSYLATQEALVTDPNMLSKVRDKLPADDPLAHSGNSDVWVANQLIPGITAGVIQGTNILDIQYGGTTPSEAAERAKAIRDAYVAASLDLEASDAKTNAAWYEEQAADIKQQLDAKVQQKLAFERRTGVVLQDDNQSVDSARLKTLAGESGVSNAVPIGQEAVNPYEAQLAALDAQIATNAKVLGPNHPEMIALKARRVALVAQAAQAEKKYGAAAQAARAARAGVGALAEAVSAQTVKVLKESPEEEQLRQIETDIGVLTKQYADAKDRAAKLQQGSGAIENDLTPLGDVQTPTTADFPVWPLILGGSIGLGVALGVLVSFVVELFGRRVRGPEDLAGSLDAPVLASIARASNDNTNGRTRRNAAGRTRRRIAPA